MKIGEKRRVRVGDHYFKARSEIEITEFVGKNLIRCIGINKNGVKIDQLLVAAEIGMVVENQS